MRKRSGSAGVSLVELSLTITMLAVGLLGSTAAIFASVRLDETVSRKREVQRTAASLTERIRATPFDEMDFAWADKSVDLDVRGKHAAATFQVTQLEADTNSPVMSVRINVSDPDGGSTPFLTTTVYVSRHPSVEPTAVDGDVQ